MKTLFDIPLAHRADPITSYEAADDVIESGELAKQEQEVYAALCNQPGRSSKELAKCLALDRYMVARRLPGLRDKGFAQHCTCCNMRKGLPCDSSCLNA